MSAQPRPISLVAERAVRYLREQDGPRDSIALAHELLRTDTNDRTVAHRLLETAFAGDPRLTHGPAGWHLATAPPGTPEPEPDRALIFIHGHRPTRGEAYLMHSISVLRLCDDEVIAACGGEISEGPTSDHLRRAVTDTLDGAVPVIHVSPGALRAFEVWIGHPLEAPVSLRKLAQDRLGLRAGDGLERLASRLGLQWRDLDDPLDQADTLDNCLRKLRREGETLYDLRVESGARMQPIDWSRLAFDRNFLRRIPTVPGTYRFFDGDGGLLYVGKSKNLNSRIGSYFRETGKRSARVQALLERLHRVEYEHSGSELEAMLREAEQIRADQPGANIQRHVHPRHGRAARLQSILILEPAESPFVLRAYLIHRGRLIERVGIGPRGGGLNRIERALDDHFFFMPVGPTALPGPDLDVEVVVRWLAANRDRAVAFDPTELRSAQEVTDRLRLFLADGGLFDPDGSPVRRR